MRKLLNIAKNENGQVLVLFALLLVVLMGSAAFAIDIGRVTVVKSDLQNAADAAALAGAMTFDNANVTAKDIAKLNGVEEVTGTTIKVEPYVTTSETTTVDAYTPEEEAAERTALTTKLNDTTQTTNDELIELANENSITAGLTTVNGTHTSAELTGKSESELIQLAKDNSITLTNYVTTTEISKYTDEQLNALNINSMSAPVLAQIAKDNNIFEKISSYFKNKIPYEYQNNNDEQSAKTTLRTELQKIKIETTKIIDGKKSDLINTIVAKLNENGTPITTITDKNALVTAIVNKLISDLQTEKVITGEKQSQRVKVTVTKKVPYTFARVIGFNDTTVTVHAVAEKSSWAGDALPFINLDGTAENSTKGVILDSWNKVGPGDKERINNDDLIISSDNIKVKYEDGFITFKKGKDSSIKKYLDDILTVGKTVYLFSLKESEMANYEKKGPKELKNGDLIPLSDVVLLECKVVEYDGKIITLQFVNSYNLDTTGITSATYGGIVNKSSTLVE